MDKYLEALKWLKEQPLPSDEKTKEQLALIFEGLQTAQLMQNLEKKSGGVPAVKLYDLLFYYLENKEKINPEDYAFTLLNHDETQDYMRYLESKDDGRICEVPVKKGDHLFLLNDAVEGKVQEVVVFDVKPEGIAILDDEGAYAGIGHIIARDDDDQTYYIHVSSLGAVTFQTREEAAEALEEE